MGDAGRFGDAAGVNNALLALGERCGLHDGPGRALERDGVDAAELDGDAPPGESGASFGDADEQQGEPAEQELWGVVSGGEDARFGSRSANRLRPGLTRLHETRAPAVDASPGDHPCPDVPAGDTERAAQNGGWPDPGGAPRSMRIGRVHQPAIGGASAHVGRRLPARRWLRLGVWKYVTVKRRTLFIEHSMDWDVHRAVFEPSGTDGRLNGQASVSLSSRGPPANNGDQRSITGMGGELPCDRDARRAGLSAAQAG